MMRLACRVWEIWWWPSYTKHLASCAFICEHPYLLCAWFTFINFNFLPIASRNFVLLFRLEELAKFIISWTIDLKPSFLLAPDRETLQDTFFDW